MEVKENYNAFKGNSKLGIKTGVQKPKPLKSSTETKLQLQTIRPEELKGNTNVNHLPRYICYLLNKVLNYPLIFQLKMYSVYSTELLSICQIKFISQK